MGGIVVATEISRMDLSLRKLNDAVASLDIRVCDAAGSICPVPDMTGPNVEVRLGNLERALAEVTRAGTGSQSQDHPQDLVAESLDLSHYYGAPTAASFAIKRSGMGPEV